MYIWLLIMIRCCMHFVYLLSSRRALLSLLVFMLFSIYSSKLYSSVDDRKALMALNEKNLLEESFVESNLPVKALWDSLQSRNKTEFPDTIYWQLSYDIAVDLCSLKKYTQNIRYISEAIPLLRKQMTVTKDNESRIIRLGFLLCESFQGVGLWEQAIDLQYKLLSKALEFNLMPEQAVIYNNISSVYYEQKAYQTTIDMLLKAVEINEQNKDKEKLFVNYNNLSAAYVGLKNYEKAIEYAFLALHQLSNLGDQDVKMLLQRNIASIYLILNELSLSEKYLSEVKNYQEKRGQNHYLSDTYKLMGDLCAKQKRIDLADIYYNKAIVIDKNKNHLAKVIKAYAQFCRQKGDLSAAYAWLDKYILLKDSILESEDNTKLTSITDMYLDEQKLRTEEARQIVFMRERYMITVIVLVIVVLLTSCLIYMILRYFYRKRKLLELQISEQARTLTSVSLDILKREEMMTCLIDELTLLQQEISPKSEKIRSKIRGIISDMLKQRGVEKKTYFEEMNLKFYNDLLKKHPSLTSRDLRLCGLIRLGLSTKEIADITCKEVRSVESARNRLRKKCNLSQQTDLFKLFNQ